MKESISFWQMAGFMFAGVVGTLLHFLFDWTEGNICVALFSAVNESIWEHLKLLFYPMVAFSLIEFCFWGRSLKSFWCIKLIGIIIGLVLIPVTYYTYIGALGINADWLNISIFFLVTAFVYWTETKLFKSGHFCCIHPKLPVILIVLLAVLFTAFTFLPPHVPLFRDPVTGTYGMCV